MATWGEFEQANPTMAAAGRRLIQQFGVGLAYLATVRRDGGPRLHPVCAILCAGGLYSLVAASPKQGDLLRDGRYALHTFPAVDRDDEFYLAGRARHRPEAKLLARVRAAQEAAGGTSSGDELLFEYDIERALLSTYKKRGEPDNWPPVYTKWFAAELG